MASAFSSTMILLLFAIAMMSLRIKANPLGASMESGKRSGSGEFLAYGSYKFIMQQDCNLVLYNDVLNKAVWHTRTSGMGSKCILKLQHDGNLVIYSNKGKVVWASNTNHNGQNFYSLILQEDHNVVVYDKGLNPIWATGIHT